MSLTPRQQFKFAFLLRCADEGLDAAQTLERIKQAEETVKQALGIPQIDVAGLIGQAKDLGWKGLGLAAGTGLGAGYGLAKLTEPEADPNEIKTQELIAAYKQQMDRIRRNMAARSYRGAAKTPRVPSLT